MSQFVSAMRAVAVAALVGGYAWTCPATATADSNSAALAKMLSKGYSTSNCKPITAGDALAAYDCGKNSLPGGPTEGEYFLFDNSNDTSAAFQRGIHDLTLTPCAPGASAPDTWHGDNSGTGGQVGCGTGDDNQPVMVWTNDANYMVAVVGGSDAKSLSQWWQTNG